MRRDDFHSRSEERSNRRCNDISKLKWQCRRGMRELDELLLGFLNRHYAAADASEKEAFQSLLSLPDPDLVSYLLQQQTPSPEFAIVIQHILDRTDP